jgi:cytochrome o ubiquinol oxidase subunit II
MLMLTQMIKTMGRTLLRLKFIFITFLATLLAGCDQKVTGILNPKGIISYEERILLFDSVALMLIVVIPVIIMSFAFIIRYREGKRTSAYKPNWGHSVFLEGFWWGIPCLIIVALGIMAWHYTHKLDPYRKIDGYPVSLKVQVVALPWKWLFIYPEQNIASVNYLKLPVNQQVQFFLTSDNVPMSAFFVPQLGSQIYTMAGMQTQLHLLATQTGTYRGLDSQYNGDGFSDMHFPVEVVDDAEMKAWFASVKNSNKTLNLSNYTKLRQNSIAHPKEFYSGVEDKLFMNIMHYYMGHGPLKFDN